MRIHCPFKAGFIGDGFEVGVVRTHLTQQTSKVAVVNVVTSLNVAESKNLKQLLSPNYTHDFDVNDRLKTRLLKSQLHQTDLSRCKCLVILHGFPL